MLTITVNAEREQTGWQLNGHSCPTLLFLLLAPALLNAVELKPETLQAWDAYVRAAKMRMEARARGEAPFLWVDENYERARQVRAGDVLVEPVGGYSPQSVTRGLIHDWIGAVFIPNTKLDDAKRVLEDYDRYKDIYRPMVAKSRLIEQKHEHEKVYLLMTQKALWVTAAAETENEVETANLSPDRTYSFSTSVQVREIADYGGQSERALPENQGPGYIWRTSLVTRLEQRDGGVYTELELIAMSRTIPVLFRWLFQPLAERLPRSVLTAMLEKTRDAVSQESKASTLRGHSAAH